MKWLRFGGEYTHRINFSLWLWSEGAVGGFINFLHQAQRSERKARASQLGYAFFAVKALNSRAGAQIPLGS